MPDIPIGGGSGPGVVLETIIGIHNARKGPPSGVPEQPGYRGPGDVIYDQRQAGATLEDVVGSGILDTPYSPAPSEQPIVPVDMPPSVPVYEPPRSPIEGDVIGPPGPPQHDYEGYYDPATEPPPEYNSGVTVEGEYTRGPDVQTGIDRRSPPAQERVDDILTRIGGSIVGRVIGRVIGVASGPIGAIIQDIITPEVLPPDPGTRGLTPYPFPVQSAPVPGASRPSTGGGHGVGTTPQRPQRPALPPVPQPPSPTPDIGDIKPWKFDSQVLKPTAPVPSPNAPPLPSITGISAPQPATSSQPAPQSPAQPNNSSASSPPSPLWWLLPSLASLTSGSTRTRLQPTLQPGVPAPRPITSPSPTTLSPGIQAPTVPSTATSAPPPPLTPSKPAALESAPAGDYCETPQQTKQRREKQRDDCERFITITIPKHKRRVCASEAGKYIGKKLGKAIGRGVGRVLRGKSFLAPERARKGKKRKEEPLVRLGRKGRSVELPGGLGIEIPKPLRSKLKIPPLPGAHRP